MTIRSGRWADLTRVDFEELDRARAIVVLPIGATEQHGPHLPVSVDSDLAEAVVERALPLVPDNLAVLALPTLAFGKSNEHGAIAGTLSLSAKTLMSILTDIGQGLSKTGFRRLVILNAHGGNSSILDIVARDIKIEFGLTVATCHWYNFNEAATLTDPSEQAYGIHAGLVETSAMLSLKPERVVMERAANFPNRAQDWQTTFRHLGLSAGRARPAWVMDELNDAGACGDAASATATMGEQLLSHAARNFADFLAEFDRFCDGRTDPLPDSR
ncbi:MULTISPECIES: creatininase family protein [unclassified Chelatococcus]|uniref:creatininase family protein n=1 Tax=unclassified Chelatococcus TaxID=2638111 RepID=UPI001BD03C7D|nr:MULTISPECIES: creatininase family protein [unclassified Chelatococcus]MBS7700688.1 creatininase family protein [Chelatococcus sp. YT9]MBX3559119.1 creatininase family protein [Chelatococcus sp.]